jgi:nitrate reductase alpha subunit
MLSFALDWARPPRHMNGTSFFYAHSDQWRYEKLDVSELLSPLADPAAYQGALNKSLGHGEMRPRGNSTSCNPSPPMF